MQVSSSTKKEKTKLEQFSDEHFKIGEKIKHKDFGFGIILGISDKKLQVRFEGSNEVIKIFSDYVSKI